VGKFTHLMRIGAAEAVLNRPADRWAELERENPPDRLGELFLKSSLKAFLDLVPHFQALGDNDRLGEEIVLELHVERQVESNRPAPNVGTPVDDIGVAPKDFVKLLRCRIRCINLAVVR